MQFKFVTSMNQEIADNCGSKMLETFIEYWPFEAEMHVYSEDDPLKAVTHDRIIYHKLQDVPGYNELEMAFSTFPIFDGIVDNKRHYQWDVHRFFRKVFAQIDAANDYEGYLFWLDSDVITLNWVDAAALEHWMEGAFIAVMKRKTWHLCSSFVGWDCSHPHAKSFWETYYRNYLSGKVLLLPQWDDAFVLEKTIEGLDGVKDIAAHVEGEGPYNVFDTVFDKIATHKKGNLKHQEKKDA
jgi:hypothetical protein